MGSLASGRLAKTIGWLITIIMIVVGTAAIAFY